MGIFFESNIRKIVREVIKEYIEPNSFNISDNDLKEIAKWGLEGDYSSSGCFDDNNGNMNKAIDCAVADFKEFLNEPYPIELGNVPREPIIYRFVKLKSLKELNKNNLGHSWFSNPEQYKIKGFFDMLDYLIPFKTKNSETYLIKAKTTINNIDIKHTLWQRSTQWQENEIVIKNDSTSKVKILDIKKASELN